MLFPITLLFSCEAGIEKKQQAEATAVPQAEPSLAVFTDTLQKLPTDSVGTINRAVSLYDELAPPDSTGADSAASALMRLVTTVVKKQNDSLFQSNRYLPLPGYTGTSLTEQQKAFVTSLHANRLKLVSDGEGGAYLVPAYETILPTVKAKTSEAVDKYLNLVAQNDTAAVFKDAGLAIELPELIDRLVLSEQLLEQGLPKAFAAETARLNKFFTDALLFGGDNTPSLAYDSTVLTENFRKAYDYLLAKYPATKAADKVNVWMAVVASGDRKKIAAFQRTK